MSRRDLEGDEYIDSRDVIDAVDELESEISDLEATISDSKESIEALMQEEEETRESASDSGQALEDLEEARQELVDTESELQDLQEELAPLKSLADEGEDYGDWAHGAQLIREDCFEDHARELATDCGMISDDTKWPCTCIDWEAAAEELLVDYMSITFGADEYWMRA